MVGVALMEFKIKPDSNLCNMSLSQFRKKYGNVIVCAIERGNELTIPNGDFVLQPQDKIFVTGNRIEVVLFHNNVRPQVIKSMMIIGAGKNCLLPTQYSSRCASQDRSQGLRGQSRTGGIL